MKLTIRDVGALGDGIGEHDGQAVFVPYTLTGEVVQAEGEMPHLTLTSVEEASSERLEPPCSHFGTCGGCSVQHWAQEGYLEWKRGLLMSALSDAKIDIEVAACVPCAPASRRRATFTARRSDEGLQFGFHKRHDDELVSLNECVVLSPTIEKYFATIAQLCPILLRAREDLQVLVTDCDNGLDLAFTCEQHPSETMEADFVRAFSRTPFLRASVNGAVLVEKEKPRVRFDDVSVAVASGTFLQSVPAIEAAIAAKVVGHIGKSKRVVDLFSGSGTFTFRMAKKARVHAVENDDLALSALSSAAGGKGLKPITTEERDLFDAPLTAKELERFDAICLDPPRAGAFEQVTQIAKSGISKVAYVSCNPASLARDLKVLLKAGYRINSATPYDQFLWSSHVEAVVLLTKPKPKNSRPIFGRKI